MPLDLIMFAALIVVILLGYPVAFSIAGVATAFALSGLVARCLLHRDDGRARPALLRRHDQSGPHRDSALRADGGGAGEVAHRGGSARDDGAVVRSRARRTRRPRVMLVGALLAASTGIVGATVVAMGLIALPAMLRNGYNPRLAAGSVCTAGTLGQIIPPSTLLIILAEVDVLRLPAGAIRHGALYRRDDFPWARPSPRRWFQA